MGKKLQGAKLRAKKRAQEAVNALQEAQADLVAQSTVAVAHNEQLFVIDATGDTQSKLYKNAIATGSFPKKSTPNTSETERRKKKTLSTSSSSAVDQALVNKLLQKNKSDPKALERIAKRGRDALPSNSSSSASGRPRKKRLVSSSSSKVAYDLWQTEDGRRVQKKPSSAAVAAAANDETMMTKEAPVALRSKPISGISQPHVPVKAKTYQLASKSKTSTDRTAVVTAESAATATATATTTAAAVPVEVATGGQSYRPDPVLHSQQLRVAFEVEQRRLNAVRDKNQPVASGMSDETKQYLVGDDSDDDSDDDDDDDDDDDTDDDDMEKGDAAVTVKKTDAKKLTPAQRRRQQKQREEKAEINRRKAEKRIQHQLSSELPKYRKELERQDRERLERKARLHALKESQKRVPGSNLEVALSQKDPVQAPTVPVALPSELGSSSGRKEPGAVASSSSSLRTLRPKGSLVLDRIHSLVDRNLVPAKNRKAAAPRKRKIKVQGRVMVGPSFEIKG